MLNIWKCIFILFLELNIYQCIGYFLCQIKYVPKTTSFLIKSVYGFLGYHVLFWCVSFPCTLLNRPLQLLMILWTILLSVLLVFICIYHFSGIIEMYRQAIFTAWRYKLFLIPCLLLTAIVTYYICINVQIDIDSRTYIGEVTSMVETGRLAGISVTTGQEIAVIYLRRSFSMFGANSAVLCKLFQIHPLVFCRTTRAAINIFLFTDVVFELFRWIFRYRKTSVEHALLCTMMTLGLLFAFSNTIYTEARFLLYRAYEGKAYCAATLLMATVFISIRLCESMDGHYFILLFLDMLTGMSISASATFALPLAGGSIILAHALYQRKWRYIPALLLAALPNLIYIFLNVSGFAGFHLEG